MGDKAFCSQKTQPMPWNWSYRFVSHCVGAGDAAWVPGRAASALTLWVGFLAPLTILFYNPPHTLLERSLRRREYVQSCHQPWGHCSMTDVDLLWKSWIKLSPAAAVPNWLANGATSLCLVQMNITSISVKHWADKDKRFAASSVSTFRLCAYVLALLENEVRVVSLGDQLPNVCTKCLPGHCRKRRCVHAAVDSKTIFLKKKKEKVICARLRFLAPTQVSVSLRWERGSGSEACNLSSCLQGLCSVQTSPGLCPLFNLLPVLSGLLCSVWGSCSLLEKKEAIEWPFNRIFSKPRLSLPFSSRLKLRVCFESSFWGPPLSARGLVSAFLEGLPHRPLHPGLCPLPHCYACVILSENITTEQQFVPCLNLQFHN